MNRGFRAHKGGINQTGFTPLDYTLLTWPVVECDTGGRFQNHCWTPVLPGESPRLVHFSGQVWVASGAYGSPPNYVAKLIKNGYPGQALFAGIGMPCGFPASFVIPFSGVDLAQPGDVYKLWLYASNGGAVVDANPAHTWFSGLAL